MRQKTSWFLLVPVLVFMIANIGFATRAWGASTFKVLYKFTGGTDGLGPQAGVIVDDEGNLYGTSVYGGDLNCPKVYPNAPSGCGTVFKLDANGTFSVLHSFVDRVDGKYPFSLLARDSAGNLYGTTWFGGNGEGTSYKVTPNAKHSVISTFNHPYNWGLVLGADGMLYGVSESGNTGAGLIFEIDPSTGVETSLFEFNGGTEGYEPISNLIRDSAGNIYGTTYYGGISSCFEGVGCGIVYELEAGGTFNVLKTFTGTDGKFPGPGTLVQDSEGNLYGSTLAGGTSPHCYAGCGVIFKLTKESDGKWDYKVIHEFAGRPASAPGGMVLDRSGNLYGTSGGGPGGEIFKLSLQADGSWAYQVIHQFAGEVAAGPNASLVIDKAGNLYGTTQSCGAGTGCYGVIFKITP